MHSHPDDKSLRDLLREQWTVAPVRNPGFRAEVWARIEAARRTPATWGAWLRLHLLGVSMVAAASIVFAGAGGGLLAGARDRHEREQLVQRYLISIDPHQSSAGEGAP
ncbi:MAG: hypothetical protein JF599_02115 [Verrucomicrobia bacterium]|nr:hypothetical protein [Verrucomicrobiota bacterium]